MKISEVEKLTGLTSKAIRLYEAKGLISVERKDNAYRDYTEEDVKQLKKIKTLRQIGISVSEIKLWIYNVISTGELLYKRKKEIEDENKTNEKQYKECLVLLSALENRFEFLPELEDEDILDEQQELQPPSDNGGRLILAVDIGTTTISTVVMDIDSRKAVETYTIPSGSDIETDSEMKKEQDADKIYCKVEKTVDFLISAYPNLKAIGLTGQMHGILYTDKDGKCISPLYTWQDQRANAFIRGGVTYCDYIFEKTGYVIKPGYGLATHYYNVKNNLVPENTVSLTTIMDYAAMRLSGRSLALMHASNAASLGLFNVSECAFDKAAIKKLGLDGITLPEVTDSDQLTGYYKGIPVAVAIGDNQASVFGSLRDEEGSVLVNYGTGSQISVVCNSPSEVEGLEIRPYIGGKYLLSGSALCGGRAYSLLEKFFRMYTAAAGGNTEPQYEIMNRLAAKAYEKEKGQFTLKATTLFCGSRENPFVRGSIENIDENNFTPEDLTLSILQGMAQELMDMYKKIEGRSTEILVASGNAVQKNAVFQKVLGDTFGMKIMLPSAKEEAAYGTALYAAVACGIVKAASEVKECIEYI